MGSRELKTPEERKARRKYMEHQRYLRNREDILAKQKVYRETHKEQIRERGASVILNESTADRMINTKDYDRRTKQRNTPAGRRRREAKGT